MSWGGRGWDATPVGRSRSFRRQSVPGRRSKMRCVARASLSAGRLRRSLALSLPEPRATDQRRSTSGGRAMAGWRSPMPANWRGWKKNRKLKKLLAESMLDVSTLKKMLGKNFWRPACGDVLWDGWSARWYLSNFLRETTLPLSPNVSSILSALFKAQALPALGEAGSGSGQTFDGNHATSRPTTQPKSTSATRCRPCSIPLSFEWCSNPLK